MQWEQKARVREVSGQAPRARMSADVSLLYALSAGVRGH